MNERITIQAKHVTRAANGEEIITWTDVDTVWAEVTQIRGKEFFAAAQMQGVMDHQVRIRYRTDITRDMKIVLGTQPLDIVSIAIVGKKDALELMCISGVRNG